MENHLSRVKYTEGSMFTVYYNANGIYLKIDRTFCSLDISFSQDKIFLMKCSLLRHIVLIIHFLAGKRYQLENKIYLWCIIYLHNSEILKDVFENNVFIEWTNILRVYLNGSGIKYILIIVKSNKWRKRRRKKL